MVIAKITSRMNITLPEEIDKRLNEVCVKLVRKEEKVIPALKLKLVRAAIEEWLNNHEDEELSLESLEAKERSAG